MRFRYQFSLQPVSNAVRSATDNPGRFGYAVHPLHVALCLTRFGADSEVVQAGLLHDVVEDCEGWTEQRLREEFGPRVAALVAEVTEDKSRTWEERQQDALDHVPRLSAAAALLKGCDKLHNLESLVLALRRASAPDDVWQAFRGGRDRTLERSGALAEALAPRVPAELSAALADALERVRETS